jgi:hypothetical protein
MISGFLRHGLTKTQKTLHLCKVNIQEKMKPLLILLFIFQTSVCTSQRATLSGKKKKLTPIQVLFTNEELSYKKVMEGYEELSLKFPFCKLEIAGNTDGGRPIHVFTMSADKNQTKEEAKTSGKLVIMINNGIHPGEPDGIESCLRFCQDIAVNKKYDLSNVLLVVIPIYNVDGNFNRSPYYREGQNGPVNPGFRGNARNLDLNRDFIKCDSENAKVFSKIYTQWDPDVFIDTHVSDGADYQHILTIVDSQKDKMSKPISELMQQNILPSIYKAMYTDGFEVCPYVNVFGDKPDNGFPGFLDLPRYASGYSTLFHSFPFITETHMLKPFDIRKQATYDFIKNAVVIAQKNKADILTARQIAKESYKTQNELAISWKLDSTKIDSIVFLGYEAEIRKSNTTGEDQLYYNQENPFKKTIKHYNTYKPIKVITKPAAYIVPQAWKEVIERLKLNGVEMSRLTNDTQLLVEYYMITDYKTVERPYEGHYLHKEVKTTAIDGTLPYFEGDYIITTNQEKFRYIVETLEPEASDAFFAWNFFDEILQQKEWFSDYLFDITADSLLRNDALLKSKFEAKKAAEPSFAKDQYAMLEFIAMNSAYHEPSHNRYPVARLKSLDGIKRKKIVE